jgi:hypothetical protein
MIGGAQVSLFPGDRYAITQPDGSYQFVNVPAGEYTIQVRRLGFEPRSERLVVAGSTTTHQTFALRRIALLDTVKSNAAQYRSASLRGFDERRANGLGTFISDSLIRAHDSERLGDFLAARLPGQRTVRAAQGGTFSLSTREKSILTHPNNFGGALPMGCYTAVYLDGQLIYNPNVKNAPGANLSDFSLASLGAIEYYAGPAQAPPQYGGSACGVLLLWTREE